MSLSKPTLEFLKFLLDQQTVPMGHPEARQTIATIQQAQDEVEAEITRLDRPTPKTRIEKSKEIKS